MTGDRYEGTFRDDMREGQGRHFYRNGTTYVGEFREGDRCGAGVLYDLDGNVLQEGEWRDDEFTAVSGI